MFEKDDNQLNNVWEALADESPPFVLGKARGISIVSDSQKLQWYERF